MQETHLPRLHRRFWSWQNVALDCGINPSADVLQEYLLGGRAIADSVCC